MAGVIRLQCPDCAKKFQWPNNQPWPEFCPHCSAIVSKGVTEIAAPFIKTAKTKAADHVYRQMEAASEQRAEAAAAMAGVPVSDMSDLKITNMRDHMKTGDIAHVPIQNDITQLMDHQNYEEVRQQAMSFAANTRVGPEVGRAQHTQTLIQREHQRRLAATVWSDTPGGGRRGVD